MLTESTTEAVSGNTPPSSRAPDSTGFRRSQHCVKAHRCRRGPRSGGGVLQVPRAPGMRRRAPPSLRCASSHLPMDVEETILSHRNAAGPFPATSNACRFYVRLLPSTGSNGPIMPLSRRMEGSPGLRPCGGESGLNGSGSETARADSDSWSGVGGSRGILDRTRAGPRRDRRPVAGLWG